LFAGGISLFHLGKVTKSYRALFNIKNSWISREIFLFSIFNLIIIIDFFNPFTTKLIIPFVSILLLFAIDMIYLKAFSTQKLKSSQTIFVAINLILIVLNLQTSLIIFTLFRVFLYLAESTIKQKAYGMFCFLRIVLLSTVTLFTVLNYNFNLSLLLFSLGEILGRIDFYNNLTLPNTFLETKKHATFLNKNP